MMTADKIKDLIKNVSRVDIVDDFIVNEEGVLSGRIRVETGSSNNSVIDWNVKIAPCYPFKVMNCEPIRFINTALIDYLHIMEDGSLCMHPAEYENAEDQFVQDLEQLKEWIDNYYITGKKDEHYEHLVVNHNLIRDEYYTYCFAETSEEFENEDFGLISYAKLAKGVKDQKTVNNFVIQRFTSIKHIKKKDHLCQLSQAYMSLKSYYGVYCMLSSAPSVHNKFINEDFDSIKTKFTQKQKDFIHNFENTYKSKINSFPLLCGYRIPDGGVHWQVIVLFMDNLPIEPLRLGTGRNRVWHTEFKSGMIPWAQTEDISYKYFFGRGAMPQKLADKKILIMGVGAIGSTIAETLTRCGGKRIMVYDIDDKEPGNVCRSAYSFYSGVTEKSYDIVGILRQISPHVECDNLNSVVDAIVKSYAAKNKDMQPIAELFNTFDIIFDCTTDNQLMQVIDASGTTAQVVNLSITNHAQDLVCAFSPNIAETVRLVYALLNRDAASDLYNPTGCWNPTFKASYNDIASKVQFALKHIIMMLSDQEPMASFFVTEDDTNLKINRL